MRRITPESAVPALVPADVCDRQEDVSGECDSVWQEPDDVNLVRCYLIAIVVAFSSSVYDCVTQVCSAPQSAVVLA